MRKPHYLYLMQIWDSQSESLNLLWTHAISDETAIESLIQKFNEIYDEEYRGYDYDPDGPLITALREDPDALKSYQDAQEYEEADRVPYGSLCYRDFFAMMDLHYQILKCEGTFNNFRVTKTMM